MIVDLSFDFTYVYMCVGESENVQVCAGANRGQKRTPDMLEQGHRWL